MKRFADTHLSRKWIVVALLWLVGCLNYVDRMTIYTLFPVIKREMAVSDVVLALLGSTFLWTYAASSPLGGYLGDRFNRKAIILWSLAIFSLITAMTGLAHNGAQLIALRVLLGVSEAFFFPAALAHIAAFHADSTRSLANSIALTGMNAGAGLGGFYSGYMADHYSWRMSFYLLGIAGVLLGLLVWKLLPAAPRVLTGPLTSPLEVHSGESIFRKIRAILGTPTAACMIFLAAALSLSSWPLGTWGPTYLHERFGMSLTKSGATMALFGYTPSLVAGLLGGIWADRWAKSNQKGRLKVQLVCMILMAPAMAAFGFIPAAMLWGCTVALYSGARQALEGNSMPIFSTVMPSTRWSTAYGVYNVAGTLAGSLGVLFVGIMKKTWGIGYCMSFLSIVLFVAIAVILVILSRFVIRDMETRTRQLGYATRL